MDNADEVADQSKVLPAFIRLTSMTDSDHEHAPALHLDPVDDALAQVTQAVAGPPADIGGRPASGGAGGCDA
jgi:hypothetical protein